MDTGGKLRTPVCLTCLVLLMASCGRASRPEPDDGEGARGSGGHNQTGGATASGGQSSEDGAGGAATGGETALGGEGGGDGLPLCENAGTTPPTLTQQIKFSHSFEDNSFEGLVRVNFSGDHAVNLQVNDATLFGLNSLFGATDDVLTSLFTEGEEVHLSLRLTEDYGSYASVLRRKDGEFIAFIHEGVFHPEVVEAMDLPIPWAVEARCKHDASLTNVLESLILRTRTRDLDVELASREEQEIEIDGRPFMLSVYYAGNIGPCSPDYCLVIDRTSGLNLDAQLIALD